MSDGVINALRKASGDRQCTIAAFLRDGDTIVSYGVASDRTYYNGKIAPSDHAEVACCRRYIGSGKKLCFQVDDSCTIQC